MKILRDAFSGRAFAHQGRHWSFPELLVGPSPAVPCGPPIWFGGTAVRGYHEACYRDDVSLCWNRTW